MKSMLTSTKYQDARLRKHTDKGELILAIVKEEAMALDAALEMEIARPAFK